VVQLERPTLLDVWPGQSTDLGRTLLDAVAALDGTGLSYVLIGGLASSVLGRPRSTEDVDLFVKAEEADAALDALASARFEIERTNPDWIYKARRDGIDFDLIFWLKGGITLDDEMVARSVECRLDGRVVRLMAPEDLVVVKAVVHDEQSPRHWHDALGIIAGSPIDWDYLARRSRHGVRRVLSLLLYAQSDDLAVPDHAIRSLYRMIYPDE
jgi:predicted nucleotidyltransferase